MFMYLLLLSAMMRATQPEIDILSHSFSFSIITNYYNNDDTVLYHLNIINEALVLLELA